MTLHTVSERGGVFYFFSVRPDAFALGVYSVIMSLLGANLLWVYALLLCFTLDHLNLARTIDRLIEIQIIFASVTTFLWWVIYSERGQSVVTHIIFYIWFGAKIMAAMLEIVFFPQFYLRLFHQSTPADLNIIIFNATWGAVVIMVLEVFGLFFAQKHFKDQRSCSRNRNFRMGKAYIDKAFNV